MFVRPFQYLTARSVDEASALLKEYGEGAKALAGGQSLMPMINLGLAQVDALVDISAIPGLEGVADQNGFLVLGALTRHRALEHDETVRRQQPLLTDAVRHVGNPRVRNLGTLGGSLAHNDPTAELPLVALVLEAECRLSDGHGERTLPIRDFLVSYYTTQLSEGELLVSVQVPALKEGWGWGFHEYAVRTGDFAVVAAAATARCVGGAIAEIRAGLAGVAETAVRLPTLEAAARGVRRDKLSRLADAVQADIEPVGDAFFSAEYRRHLASILALRAIEDACRRSEGGEL